MLVPINRQITAKFRKDGGTLSQAGDEELQYSPIELLSQRKQKDFPEAKTFSVMNGCRGTVYEAGNTNITTLKPGADFDVEWIIQAPHPGTMKLSIVKPSTDSSGKIMYKNYKTIITLDSFAQNGGTGSTTATMPTGVVGCGKAGDCALQMEAYRGNAHHADQISEQYLKDSGVLINIGGGQVQIAPLEGLAQHKQADFPIAPTFDLMNGCRGTVYEEGNNVTTLQPGGDFDVRWTIMAPHPGYMKLSIVKPSEESTGKIMYKNYKTILTIEPFGENGGEGSAAATMPNGVEGCEKPGDCALQFYWHSDIADQTYVTCADIIVPGSGGSATPTAPKATKATPKTTPKPITATPKPTTAAPKATKGSSTYKSEASVAGEADSTGKCTRRMRRE
ncbi:hypothetical protein BBP00_00008379 [Phytophthora kernoviae]|nr:hypothetical protein BBP00_00008379 [Phytophthora kernoviae]